jgi:hypothetical protein
MQDETLTIENVAELKYFGSAGTNQDFIYMELKADLIPAVYPTVHFRIIFLCTIKNIRF